MKKRVLIVDDEAAIRLAFRYTLPVDELEAEEAESAVGGLVKLEQRRFDLILLDLRLQGLNGLEFLTALRARKVDVPTVLVSAFATSDTALAAVRLGTVDFLAKPVTPAQLRHRLTLVLLRHELQDDDANLWPCGIFEQTLNTALLAINRLDFPTARQRLHEALRLEDKLEVHLLLGILHELERDLDTAEAEYRLSLPPLLRNRPDLWKRQNYFTRLAAM
ncbi:MAG: response regulator [Verrucomicrobia bacterium]|nr:response regulator [Verrucomicrobiota bacterium]